MGEIADGIINGDFDEQTGEYLGPGDGYPRTKEPGHYNSMRRSNPMFGIEKYLREYNSEINQGVAVKLVDKYCKVVLNTEVAKYKKQCALIQTDFGKFTTWIKHHSEY